MVRKVHKRQNPLIASKFIQEDKTSHPEDVLNQVDQNILSETKAYILRLENQLETVIQNLRPKPEPPPVNELRIPKKEMQESVKNKRYMAWVYSIQSIPSNANMNVLSKFTLSLAKEHKNLSFLLAIEILLRKKGNEINEQLKKNGKPPENIPSLLPNIKEAIMNQKNYAIASSQKPR